MKIKPVTELKTGDVLKAQDGKTYTITDIMDWPGERWLYLDSGDCVPMPDDKVVMVAS